MFSGPFEQKCEDTLRPWQYGVDAVQVIAGHRSKSLERVQKEFIELDARHFLLTLQRLTFGYHLGITLVTTEVNSAGGALYPSTFFCSWHAVACPLWAFFFHCMQRLAHCCEEEITVFMLCSTFCSSSLVPPGSSSLQCPVRGLSTLHPGAHFSLTCEPVHDPSRPDRTRHQSHGNHTSDALVDALNPPTLRQMSF